MNKGSSLIEFCLIIPLLMGLCFGIELIFRGWDHRMTALFISRYVSTYTLRIETLPHESDLKNKFRIDRDSHIKITDDQSVEVSFHLFGLRQELKISKTLWIWRP